MQDLSDLLLIKLLVDLGIKELCKETKRLCMGKTLLLVFGGRILRHLSQEVVPSAIGHFDSSDDTRADTGVIAGVPILAQKTLQEGFLDLAPHLFSHIEP